MKVMTSFRLEKDIYSKLKTLAREKKYSMVRVLEELIEGAYLKQASGVEWLGTGIWKGWRIAHLPGRTGPILIGPNGDEYKPINGELHKV